MLSRLSITALKSRATGRASSSPASSVLLLRHHNNRRYLKTLTLNAGSTTLKYSLYDVNAPNNATLLSSGMVDKVGNKDASITHNGKLMRQEEPIHSHVEALEHVVDILQQEQSKQLKSNDTFEVDCIGHRVVHGGPHFSEPTRITPEVVQTIESLCPLAPLHNPPALAGIKASQALFANAEQVAVFDTAFHTATLPPSAYRYAIPQAWANDYHIRRYGFHGTSVQYVLGETAKYMNTVPSQLNCIVMHLGGGASMTCIEKGKSVQTTMGFTPLEGLVMATRAGDLDAGVYNYLMEEHGYTADEVYSQLNKQSGLLGLSGGLSSDMRVIKEKALAGDSTCRLARDVFVERIRKYIGAYYVQLHGKVDAIIFTGGIGENDEATREAVLEGLQEELQIAVDPTKNLVASAGAASGKVMEIHPAFSKTKVLVVPTNEELSIALQASASVVPEVEALPVAAEIPTSITTPKHFTTNLFCHSLGHSYTGPEELGLLSIFAASANNFGYFRPIGRGGGTDYRIELMKDHFGLEDSEEEMFGVEEDEAWDLIAAGREDELFERILQKYLAYSSKKDFVMVSTFTEEDDSLHFAGKLCSALNIPAVLVGNAEHDTQLGIARTAFKSHGANCVGAVISRVTDEQKERKKLESMHMKPVALLPKSEILNKRTLREVMKVLDDSVCLYGAEHLDSTMDSMRIYTVQADDMLDLVKDDELAIVNHKRVDSLISLILAAQSSNAPTPAGVLLTLHEPGKMNPKIASLLDGIKDIRIPIIATSSDTIEAAQLLAQTPEFLTACSKEKVDEAKTRMEIYFDHAFLDLLQDEDGSAPAAVERDIGPRLFQYSTFLKARQLQKTIVLPEGADPRVVEAASILIKRKLCKVILVGETSVIHANAEKLRVSLEGITIADPSNYDRMDEMVEAFVEARKAKGLTAVEAKKYLLQDVSYFGTLMVHLGIAEGMVSGAMHSSANTIRPALQVLKTAPGASLVSSIFFMLLEDGVKVFGDCAINTAPDAVQLSEIAVASAKTAKQFGIDPRVALLSYATGESNKGELIDKVIKATTAAKEAAKREGFMDPDMIAGPLQFDAAVDPLVAAVKAKDSPVAGRANVLIFPDLNSGNNGYKAVQQASKTIAVGPILQGLQKPVNDLSRGATVDDIVNTAVLTALQADM